MRSNLRGRIINLGLVEYEKVLAKQREFVNGRMQNVIEDTILLVEHLPVYTIGKCGDLKNLLVDKNRLQSLGMSVVHVERGGDITYHGPGQLVIYPIISLKDRNITVEELIYLLEECAISILKKFEIKGERSSRNRGVWVGNDKIASIGLSIKKGVSFHGMALNYNVDLNNFEMINPCGLNNVKMTSIKKLLGEPIDSILVYKYAKDVLKEVFSGEWDELSPTESCY